MKYVTRMDKTCASYLSMLQVTLMNGSGRYFSGWAAASSTNIHRGSCFSIGKEKRSVQKEKEILGCRSS